MGGPFITPQQIFDSSTLVTAIGAIKAATQCQSAVVDLTTNVAMGVKGVYAEYFPVLPFDLIGFCFISLYSNDGVNPGFYDIDISMGLAGGEIVLIPDIRCSWRDPLQGIMIGASPYVPFSLPAGIRIAGRVANVSVAAPRIVTTQLLIFGA